MKVSNVAVWMLAGVLSLGAQMASADDWPFMILRSYGIAARNPRLTARIFAAQERHPGLINEIWFAGGVPGKLQVRLVTDGYSVAVFCRKRADGSPAGVMLFNLGAGETPPLRLAIRCGSGRFKLRRPFADADEPLKVVSKSADEVVVEIPPMPALELSPQAYASGYPETNGVKSIFFDGEPYKGKPTRVFGRQGGEIT